MRLNLGHRSQKSAVVAGAVSAGMHPPVAIRAECDDVAWMVWAPIADAKQMVRLQVGGPILALEGGRCTTSFAVLIGPRENVIPDTAASLVNIPNCSAVGAGRDCCVGKGPYSQVFEGGSERVHFLDLLCDRVKISQFKYDGVPQLAVSIGSFLDVIAVADHLPLEAEPFSLTQIEEQEKAFPVDGVVRNCGVATDHLHIAYLPGTKIFKRSVGAPAIGVTVCASGVAGYSNHERVAGESNYPALATAFALKSIMDVCAPIINAAFLEAPTHPVPSSSRVILRQDGCQAVAERVAA